MLSSFGQIPEDQLIQVDIDNSRACRILTTGSYKIFLQNTALYVFSFSLPDNINLIT